MTSTIEVMSLGDFSKPVDAIYHHFIINTECFTEAGAEEKLELLHKMIQVLSGAFPVYVRKSPEVVEEREFEENTVKWFVRGRITVGSTKYHPAGMMVSVRGKYRNLGDV